MGAFQTFVRITGKLTIIQKVSPMFKTFDRDQLFLLPPSLQDLIPKGDLVFVITEVMKSMDLHPLIKKYNSLGQNAYHPAMMLGILFYSYARGIFSSRKIAQQLKENIRFMYLAGMQTPDFRTISDFRKNNIDLLKDYFIQVVTLCQRAGMTSLGSIAIDGSKFQAAASKKQTLNKKQLAEQLSATEKEIEQLLAFAEAADEQDASDEDDPSPSEIQINDLEELRRKLREAQDHLDKHPQQQTINLTDPECRTLHNTGPGYNAQLAVDCESQIIVGIDVVSEVNDTHQLLPMIEEVEASTKSKGSHKRVFADSGYALAEAFHQLESMPHIDAFVPTREQVHRQRKSVGPFDRSHFDIDPVLETCRCPMGHQMRKSRRGINKSGNAYIRFIGTKCKDCPVKSQCTKAPYRSVVMLLAQPAMDRMKAKMNSPDGSRAMQQRKQSVEPVFGQLKENLGFRRFHLRGLSKVKGEFALLSAAFNLKKLHEFLNGQALSGALAAIRLATPLNAVFQLMLRFFIPFRRLAFIPAP